MVGKNNKLFETIEASALWSNLAAGGEVVQVKLHVGRAGEAHEPMTRVDQGDGESVGDELNKVQHGPPVVRVVEHDGARGIKDEHNVGPGITG